MITSESENAAETSKFVTISSDSITIPSENVTNNDIKKSSENVRKESKEMMESSVHIIKKSNNITKHELPFELGWLKKRPNPDGSYILYVHTSHRETQKVEGELGLSRPVTFYLRSKKQLLGDKHLLGDISKVLILPKETGIKVGPVIGILTTARPTGGFAGNRYNFRDLIQSARQHGGLVYVFTPQTYQKASNTLQAYVYRTSSKNWVKQTMPLPDVVYNRISSRHEEARPGVQAVLHQLATHPQLKMFNPGFLNKWDVYQWLINEEVLHPYLPETKRYSEQAMQEMLKRYASLYLKPTNSKAGIGIYRLDQTVQGYRLQGKSGRERESIFFADTRSLLSSLSKRLNKKPYLIQQTIALATYPLHQKGMIKKRRFDLRVLVQKDLHGIWKISGIGARVSGPSSITTHVPQGGFIVSPQEALSASFSLDETAQILKRTNELAITAAKTIESHIHPLGELSMDIGVDHSGHLWLFEANAKPMKFDEPRIRARSLRRLLEYSAYLAGFMQTASDKNRLHYKTKHS